MIGINRFKASWYTWKYKQNKC